MGKSITELVTEAHQNAVEHGWWDRPTNGDVRSFGELIALVHSELSEALEFYRDGSDVTELLFTHNGLKPDGVPAELADAVIRIFDMCGHYGIDLEEAILEKMDYNKSRPYRHGGKAL